MPRQKSPEKRQLIISTAKDLFLKHSYAEVSMINISKQSGIAKNTVYCHFENKEALYMAVLKEHWSQKTLPKIDVNDPRDMEVALTDFSNDVIRFLYHKDTIAFFRTLVSEAARFPMLANAIITDERGPAMSNLKEYFSTQTTKDADGAERAARYFFGLLYVDTFWHMLAGFRKKYTKTQLETHISQLVTFFVQSFDNI